MHSVAQAFVLFTVYIFKGHHVLEFGLAGTWVYHTECFREALAAGLVAGLPVGTHLVSIRVVSAHVLLSPTSHSTFQKAMEAVSA